MNKGIAISVITLVVVVGGAFTAYAVTRPGDPPVAQETTPASTPSTTPSSTNPPSSEASPGAYVDYSSTAIADAEGTVLLFFHAPWCPQCRSIEEDILNSGVPTGVTVIKVDYDSNQKLRQLYGVTVQTTFVEVDSAGTGIQLYSAYDNPSLQAVIDEML